MDPLAQGEDKLNRLHSNMQIPKVIGAARIYEMTGDEHFADIAEFFWKDVTQNRSFVIGGNGDREHFFPTNDFAGHLSAETAETCCTYNMLKLTRHLFEWSPDAAEMDYYERALYNHILAAQDPDTGAFAYFMSLKPGHFKTYSTSENSFWCCVGTGMENHAKYGDMIYFHGDNSLFVNLFIHVRTFLAGEKSRRAAGDNISRKRHHPAEFQIASPRPTRLENPLAGVGGNDCRARGRRKAKDFRHARLLFHT